jgi:5'(3')-deoxyribonucleotidase
VRIGFDVDGVLADFTRSFVPLLIRVTGKNLFQPDDINNPPCWNWDLHRGYTKDESRMAWAVIKESRDFWASLRTTPQVRTLRMMILDLLRNHEVYFITNRTGTDVKWQTELWLRQHLQIDLPTVLISGAKGLCAQALKLDVYVDDNADNVNDVVNRTGPEQSRNSCRTYLLDTTYNRPGGPENVVVDARVNRVSTLGQMFDAELANL